jgi:hypothetical protein
MMISRYPTGKWVRQPSLDAKGCADMIQAIAVTPANLAAAVKGLTDAQLDTPYRPGGWTPRQIVHHIADSHMNAYIRFKLGITEDNPTVKPYDEKKWADTIDSGSARRTSRWRSSTVCIAGRCSLKSSTPRPSRAPFSIPNAAR